MLSGFNSKDTWYFMNEYEKYGGLKVRWVRNNGLKDSGSSHLSLHSLVLFNSFIEA